MINMMISAVTMYFQIEFEGKIEILPFWRFFIALYTILRTIVRLFLFSFLMSCSYKTVTLDTHTPYDRLW